MSDAIADGDFPARMIAIYCAVAIRNGWSGGAVLAGAPNFFVNDDITISASARAPEISFP